MKLKDLGAEHIYAAITHGILSRDGVDKVKLSAIEKLIITDSIPLPLEKHIDKIEVLSLAPMMAGVIKAIELGTSLSEAQRAFADAAFEK
jgi:ribose-phosphate pyrophosphokinase